MDMGVVQNKRSQTQKSLYCIIPFCKIQQKAKTKRGTRIAVTLEMGVGGRGLGAKKHERKPGMMKIPKVLMEVVIAWCIHMQNIIALYI